MWFLLYTFPASSDHTGKKRSVLPCVTRPTRLSYRGGTQVGLRRQVTGTRVPSDYPSWSLVPLFLWAGLTLIYCSPVSHTHKGKLPSVSSLCAPKLETSRKGSHWPVGQCLLQARGRGAICKKVVTPIPVRDQRRRRCQFYEEVGRVLSGPKCATSTAQSMGVRKVS